MQNTKYNIRLIHVQILTFSTFSSLCYHLRPPPCVPHSTVERHLKSLWMFNWKYIFINLKLATAALNVLITSLPPLQHTQFRYPHHRRRHHLHPEGLLWDPHCHHRVVGYHKFSVYTCLCISGHSSNRHNSPWCTCWGMCKPATQGQHQELAGRASSQWTECLFHLQFQLSSHSQLDLELVGHFQGSVSTTQLGSLPSGHASTGSPDREAVDGIQFHHSFSRTTGIWAHWFQILAVWGHTADKWTFLTSQTVHVTIPNPYQDLKMPAEHLGWISASWVPTVFFFLQRSSQNHNQYMNATQGEQCKQKVQREDATLPMSISCVWVLVSLLWYKGALTALQKAMFSTKTSVSLELIITAS